jgi:hypothetical protein
MRKETISDKEHLYVEEAIHTEGDRERSVAGRSISGEQKLTDRFRVVPVRT